MDSTSRVHHNDSKCARPGRHLWAREIPNTTCRDGSPAGLFYKCSASSTNYFVFLEGGGACFDDFFCPVNPKNVNETVNGETILHSALVNFGGAAQVPQAPRVAGIFKNDPRNRVADWNAIYVPYWRVGNINAPKLNLPPLVFRSYLLRSRRPTPPRRLVQHYVSL